MDVPYNTTQAFKGTHYHQQPQAVFGRSEIVTLVSALSMAMCP